MMSEVKNDSFLKRLISPPPILRGVLVHQSAQQIDKAPVDFFSIFFREIMNILWPAPGGNRDTHKKTITSVRIRLEDGRQREARFDGDFLLGSVALGDEIALWGYRRRGTLIVKRAYNHTTEAKITMRGQTNSGGNTLLLIVALLMAVVALMVMQGWLVLTPHIALKLPF